MPLIRAPWLARPALLLLLPMIAGACGGGGESSPSSDVAGISTGDYSAISGDVSIDGSSTVGPIAEAAAEEFGAVSNANVVVGISGTGGGFEKFCRGEIDISNASRPIKRDEFQLCTDNGIELTEVSIGYDGLTVAVNPQNTWANCLTFTQLRQILDEGSSINNWNQLDPTFPDQPIMIFSPGADSGTFDFFTEEVNGVLDRTRSDGLVTFSEDDNVLVLGIESNPGAIGYFGYAYYIASQDRLKALQLDRDITKDGLPVPGDQRRGCVGPDEATVKSATYSLSRPLFMYINNESLKDNPAVRGFIDFVLKNPDLVSEVGYIQLDAGIYQQNLTKVAAVQ